MIKLVSIVLVGLLSVMLIGAYLGPDDLAKCTSVPSEEMGCKKVDAIIAVSGGDTNARTDKAVELYKNGWAETLVFSGAAADKSGPSNAEAMRQYALSQGVPSGAIVTEGSSETTHENAKLSYGVFQSYDFRTVILVTSGYHQRRASIEFRKSVGENTVILNHPVKQDNQWSQWWWLTPSGWYLAGSEITKILLVYLGVSR